MKIRILGILSTAAVAHLMGTAQAQVDNTPANLAFVASGPNEFGFDTGVVKGKLHAGGKSTGLSSVVHIPTGLRLDSSMGLFSHYRVFTTNKRYGTAAWDWPSEAQLERSSVEVRWPSAEDRPFELRARYWWVGPNILEVDTTVQAKAKLSKFESFLASYFSDGFTNASVYVRSNDGPQLMRAEKRGGQWQAFPRDAEAVSIIQDGRWKFPPSPVDWVIEPSLASPLGIRCCPARNLNVLLMARPEDAFAILTPCETDGHRSMYFSLFGKDLQPGETAEARARLVFFGADVSGGNVGKIYVDVMRTIR
jgi:hypothetical protein